MRIIPVMIRQLKINLQVKSDPLIYKKLTKSVNIQSSLLPSPLALHSLATMSYIISPGFSGQFSICIQDSQVRLSYVPPGFSGYTICVCRILRSGCHMCPQDSQARLSYVPPGFSGQIVICAPRSLRSDYIAFK